jgi:hypothetical protein
MLNGGHGGEAPAHKESERGGSNVIAMRGEAAVRDLPVTVTGRLDSEQPATPMGRRGLLSGGLSWPPHEDAWAKGGGWSN